jgi:short-subunit dehydrogenase involved in D-alanine esterification of teichoic acids
METMKLRSQIGTDGILQIQMPTELKNTSVEVVVVIQPLSSEETKPQYNAWGKLTTKQSIQEAVAKMQQLRQKVGIDKNSIREMIEEGRRF